MHIEISIVISCAALIFSIVIGALNHRRDQKTDDTLDGREMGTLLSDLKHVKSTVDKIDHKFESYNREFAELSTKVAAHDRDIKNMQVRVNLLSEKALNLKGE